MVMSWTVSKWSCLGQFLEAYSPPKLNSEEIDNFNRLTTRTEIESII